MDRRFSPFLLTISILIILSLACTFSGVADSSLSTRVAQTVAALATPAEMIITPSLPVNRSVESETPTLTVIPITPTVTFSPVAPTLTNTLVTPTLTFTPTLTPLPCNAAKFVTDVTIPDGTTIPAGGSFTKTWRLKNVGSCTWTSDYKLVFDHGDALNGPAEKEINATVTPGSTVDLSVNLKAPTSIGGYKGYWKLKTNSGTTFGIGADHNGTFAVVIQVLATPHPPFAVTSVNANVQPSGYSGNCVLPQNLKLIAQIKVNGAGTVKYHWKSDVGDIGSMMSLDFADAGSKSTSPVPLPHFSATKTGWVAVYIDSPNHQMFDQVTYKIHCQSPDL